MRSLLLTVLLLGFLSLLHAQDKTVKGTIRNSDREPLPGATVTVKGSSESTYTDENGNFVIAISPGEAVLNISYVGYNDQSISVGNRSQIDIELVANNEKSLEDVVVVGYATAKKSTLTGSVSTVKGSDVRQAPVMNVTNALVGRLPGVTSVQRTGEPGKDDASLTIRGVNGIGNNSPLIVVDGVPLRSLSRVDPNTIESVTVLKDASAAIYGSESANGVILVTTKRGKTGKPSVQFNLNKSLNQATFIPRMTSSSEYATLLNEIDVEAGRAKRYSDEDLRKYADGSDPWRYPNTDWYRDIMKEWSPQHDLGVTVSGGTENVKYFVGMGTKFQDAFYKNSNADFRQHNFLSNIDIKISKNISFRFDVVGRLENTNHSMMGSGEIYRLATSGQPYRPAYWPNGLPAPSIGDNGNPVVMGTGEAGFDKQENYVLNSTAQLNITIPWVKGLSFNTMAAYDKTFLYRKRFQHAFTLYSWDGVTVDGENTPVVQPMKIGTPDPRLNQWAANNQNVLLNGILNYANNFGGHGVKFLAGVERRTYYNSNFDAYKRFFLSTTVPELFAGGNPDRSVNGNSAHGARLNYFGRVNYDFDQKYLLEFVWRYDGSHIFPSHSRFGFFPGASAGWVISKENFWKDNVKVLDFLKLRASWGQTGNDRIDQWQFLSTYALRPASGGNLYLFDVTGENQRLYEARIPNPDVTWEVADQKNIGFDAALLSNKLTVSFDYFKNIRSNMLWFRNATVPAMAGVTLPRENIAKAENKGIEAVVSYSDRMGKLNYTVSANYSTQKNKVLFWDEPAGRLPWQSSTGKPIPTNPSSETGDWYYDAIGIFKDQADLDKYPHWSGAKPGDIIFRDVNEDGVIDGNDRIRLDKTNIPTYIYGFNINLSYAGFDLSVLFQGAGGHVRYVFTESGEIGNFLKDFYDHRWTPENPNSVGPRVYNRNSTYWTNNNSTYFLENADYLRIKTIELGYSLPSRITNKFWSNGARIFASGFNLFTFTGMKDFDPESVYTGAFSQTYPVQRVLNFGINLNF